MDQRDESMIHVPLSTVRFPKILKSQQHKEES